ncbi:hypothetical protein K523DRAFT_359182 [Schizophyllum commune Tattone D]|nr:hypothetical protein K523DRAFT_359182 [Schizophyllum commune Tattone D]
MWLLPRMAGALAGAGVGGIAGAGGLGVVGLGGAIARVLSTLSPRALLIVIGALLGL